MSIATPELYPDEQTTRSDLLNKFPIQGYDLKDERVLNSLRKEVKAAKGFKKNEDIFISLRYIRKSTERLTLGFLNRKIDVYWDRIKKDGSPFWRLAMWEDHTKSQNLSYHSNLEKPTYVGILDAPGHSIYCSTSNHKHFYNYIYTEGIDKSAKICLKRDDPSDLSKQSFSLLYRSTLYRGIIDEFFTCLTGMKNRLKKELLINLP